jgi:hypothetical protein
MTKTTLIRLLPLLAVALLLPVGTGQAWAADSMQSTDDRPAQAAPASKPAAAKATASPEVENNAKAVAPPKKLDLDTLIERLKQTQAIGVLTKLVLRSDVTDLINEVKLYKRTKGSTRQLDRIKAHFNGLLLKVLALLDDDPKLAQDIQSARASLWQHLMEVKI